MGQAPESIRQRGTRIAKRFVLVRFLGRSSHQTETWAANDEVEKRLVVLKFLPYALYEHPRCRARLQQRFSLVQALDHPVVPPLISFEAVEQHGIIIASRYVKGKNLAHLLQVSEQRRLYFHLEFIFKILSHVASAFDAAHHLRVFHLSLNPNNVLVSAKENIWVTDFLLPFEVNESLQMIGTAALKETPHFQYTMPEQYQGGKFSQRADQYLLAMLAYRLLAGCYPWGVQDQLDWGNLLFNESIPPIHQLQICDVVSCHLNQLNDVLAQALSVSPEKRFVSCHAFERRLRQCFPTLKMATQMFDLPEEPVQVFDDPQEVILQQQRMERQLKKYEDVLREVDEKKFRISLSTLGWATNLILVIAIISTLMYRRDTVRDFLFPNKTEEASIVEPVKTSQKAIDTSKSRTGTSFQPIQSNDIDKTHIPPPPAIGTSTNTPTAPLSTAPQASIVSQGISQLFLHEELENNESKVSVPVKRSANYPEYPEDVEHQQWTMFSEPGNSTNNFEPSTNSISLLEEERVKSDATLVYRSGFTSEGWEMPLQMFYDLSEKDYFLWRHTAESQVPEGYYLLGLSYAYYTVDGRQNYPESAFYYLSKAAEMGYAPAQFEVALCFELGFGVDANAQNAVEWLQIASENNEPRALYEMAVRCKQEGHFEEARYLFEKAAMTGYMPAQLELNLLNSLFE